MTLAMMAQAKKRKHANDANRRLSSKMVQLTNAFVQMRLDQMMLPVSVKKPRRTMWDPKE